LDERRVLVILVERLLVSKHITQLGFHGNMR